MRCVQWRKAEVVDKAAGEEFETCFIIWQGSHYQAFMHRRISTIKSQQEANGTSAKERVNGRSIVIQKSFLPSPPRLNITISIAVVHKTHSTSGFATNSLPYPLIVVDLSSTLPLRRRSSAVLFFVCSSSPGALNRFGSPATLPKLFSLSVSSLFPLSRSCRPGRCGVYWLDAGDPCIFGWSSDDDRRGPNDGGAPW
jgi:hypothetical protein